VVSRVARHLLQTLGGIVALGMMPSAGFPQSPADRVQADADRQRIGEAIIAAQAEGGPRSPELITPLTELGDLLATEGEHALATAALEEARHVVRATYGLHTLDQLPLLEQALENQRALGDFAMAQALEEKLYILAERHPDDLRTVAIHRGMAERKMDLLRRFLAYEYPPEIYPEVGFFAVTSDAVVQKLVLEAQVRYADAAAVLLRNGLRSSDALRELEMQIVRSSDVFRERTRLDTRSMFVGRQRGQGGLPVVNQGPVDERCMPGSCTRVSEKLRRRTNRLWDLAALEASQDEEKRRYRVDHITSHYELARESHRRLVVYAGEASARSPDDALAWENQVRAYVELADWDLLYSQNGVAFGEYEQLHEMFEAADGPEQLIAETFAPPIPIVLPTFKPNPLDTPRSARYIDVGFEVTRYGESRRIEILAATAGVPDSAKTTLVNLINVSRFRPRVTDGELGRASPVVLRYYLND
jgi:hypothetical protein